MICFIALIVFGIMGIFSATHRKIAVEAFDCVFRKLTLRKCSTGLDTRIKSSITGKFLRKNPKTGKFIYKHFEIISWMFTILLIASMVWTGISGYNYYVYGNCNGPSVEDQGGLCLFDPTGSNSEITKCDNEDVETQTAGQEPTIENVDLSLFPTYKPKDAKDKLVYVGCYTCVNTRKVNPTINELVVNNKETLEFVFLHLPLHKEYEYISRIENCIYESNKVAFWKFHNALMQMPLADLDDQDKVYSVLDEIEISDNIDKQKIIFCSQTIQAKELLEKQVSEMKKMNVEGTPTIFVNEQAFIGPKPLRVYEKQLSTDVDWFGMALISLGALILLIMIYFAVFKRE
jgi:hypothetical protein